MLLEIVGELNAQGDLPLSLKAIGRVLDEDDEKAQRTDPVLLRRITEHRKIQSQADFSEIGTHYWVYRNKILRLRRAAQLGET